MTLTDYMCQGKKGEEDSPALKIALMHRYNKEEYIEKREEKIITILTT